MSLRDELLAAQTDAEKATVLAFTGTGFTGTIDNVVLTPLTGSGTVTGTVTVAWVSAGDF